MKVSGFYMSNGKNKGEARNNVENMFKEEIAPILSVVLGENYFETTDVVRTEEYDEEDSKAFDVHFILDIPRINFEEYTEPFYNLEKMVCTGLGIVDNSLGLSCDNMEKLKDIAKEVTIKNKSYYIGQFTRESEEGRQEYIEEVGNDKKYDELDYIYTADAIVGYYISVYGDEALDVWLKNLSLATHKHDTDSEVTKILKQIYR
mgnify:CR=1 FL=1